MGIAAVVLVSAIAIPFLLPSHGKSTSGTPKACTGCSPVLVSISPASVKLGFGQQQDFRALAWNQSGAVIPSGVTYSWIVSPGALGALNATSGETVQFTSGTTNLTGNLTVTATGNSESKSANVSIIVTAKEVSCSVPAGLTLNGAGSTLVAPLMNAWALAYTNSTVNYLAEGSGAGITDIIEKTIDFGATDAPLSPSEVATEPAPGLFTFPESAGAVVPIYNLPSVSNPLKFTGQILAGIYLGDITNWNNSALQAVNPGVVLPNATIVAVHRSDASGTTFVWSSYLSKSNATWNSTVGRGLSLFWPSIGVGAKGSSGMTEAVQSMPDSIGYVDLSYALSDAIPYGAVQNPAGNYILADLADTESALSDARVLFPTPGGTWYNVSVLDAPGPGDYPIVTYTYVLVYSDLGEAYGSSYSMAHAQALVDFLSWIVSAAGQSYSAPLFYAPISSSVINYDLNVIDSVTYDGAALGACAP